MKQTLILIKDRDLFGGSWRLIEKNSFWPSVSCTAESTNDSAVKHHNHPPTPALLTPLWLVGMH